MISVTHVSIPVNTTTFAALLWIAAVSLMTAATVSPGGRQFLLASWALLVAGAAVVCSVAALIRSARGVLLDVMSWEHKHILADTAALRGTEVTEPLRAVPLQRESASANRSRVD